MSSADDVRVVTRSSDLDDYDIISIQSISAAVPHKTTESFRHYIWAAMATYAFGNKSVDHVMRQYDYIWQRVRNGVFEKNPRILLLRSMMEKIQTISNDLEMKETKNELCFVCSKAALVRLEASFKAAYGLIRKEYIFESDAVIRIILEQLAWSYSAIQTNPEKLGSLRPNKCITKLKDVCPEAGMLYGRLSEWAHIDPFIITEYQRFHKEKIPVVRRSQHNSLQSGVNLIYLSTIYIKVIQTIFEMYEKDVYSEKLDELIGLYQLYLDSDSDTNSEFK